MLLNRESEQACRLSPCGMHLIIGLQFECPQLKSDICKGSWGSKEE